MKKEIIPIVIPSYEPDYKLIDLLKKLINTQQNPIVIINDGSDENYKEIFAEAEKELKEHEGIILVHEVNKGKGRALKTAFKYILQEYPEAVGCVTADSDGQHTIEGIGSIVLALRENPHKLILGVRNFSENSIPWKSRVGNVFSEKIFAYASGAHVSDTQTGLRGIPIEFMKTLLHVPGERFEFETQMLLECVGKYEIMEIPIETVYDSTSNHQTHFKPIVDSLKICKVLGKKFAKYIFSSFSSSIIDFVLFTILCNIFRSDTVFYIAIATILARIVSAIYNFFINYKIVFKSKEKVEISGIKYMALALTQMCCSAVMVTIGVWLLPFIPEIVDKIIVDTLLFFVSYYIQQKYVFHRKLKNGS